MAKIVQIRMLPIELLKLSAIESIILCLFIVWRKKSRQTHNTKAKLNLPHTD